MRQREPGAKPASLQFSITLNLNIDCRHLMYDDDDPNDKLRVTFYLLYFFTYRRVHLTAAFHDNSGFIKIRSRHVGLQFETVS